MKLTFLTLAIAVLLGQCLSVAAQTTDKQPGSPAAQLNPTTIEQLRGLEASIQNSIEMALPSIVAIGNRFGRSETSQIALEGKRFASGVIISEDGLVLSQYHVTHTGAYDKTLGLRVYGEIGDEVEVVLANGKRVTGKLLGGYRLADISLVKINEPGPYPYLKFDSLSPVKLGDWNIKLGHPNGYRTARGASARLGRAAYVNELDLVSSCSIDGGDSGGPLINLRSEIVGLINDSYMPNEAHQVAQPRGFPMSYMTTARIHEFLEPIRTKLIPDTTHRNHFERKANFEKVTETARPEMCDEGLGLASTYVPLTGGSRENVIEVLNADKSRAAYGTIISHDGLIVTLASRVKDYPVCRLYDNSLTTAQVIGSDQDTDLALLKITLPTRPVQWATQTDIRRGTLLLAPTRDKRWGLGILCAPTYTSAHGFFAPLDQPEQLTARTWPIAFEHDVPLKADALGGPVLNLDGQAVGISVAGAGLHGSLAIPVEHVKAVVGKLKPDF